MGLIEAIEAEGMKENVPQFNVGDTVKVGYRIIEGGKERIQNVERCFPLHSPKVAYVTVVRAGKVRRAKLYYLRGLTGKAAKIKEKK